MRTKILHGAIRFRQISWHWLPVSLLRSNIQWPWIIWAWQVHVPIIIEIMLHFIRITHGTVKAVCGEQLLVLMQRHRFRFPMISVSTQRKVLLRTKRKSPTCHRMIWKIKNLPIRLHWNRTHKIPQIIMERPLLWQMFFRTVWRWQTVIYHRWFL